jgi:hypothetical protein
MVAHKAVRKYGGKGINRVTKCCLASLMMIGSAQAKDQMVTFHVSGEGHYSFDTVTIGNSYVWRVGCNACDTDPNVITRAFQSGDRWRKALPPDVPENSILVTVCIGRRKLTN